MPPAELAQLEGVRQIAIIGTGLLGASIGLGLKAAGYAGRIVGLGRNPQTLEQAMASGGFDAVETDYAQAIPDAQLAIVCVPLGAFDRVLGLIAPHDHADLAITDAGSTKRSVLAAARQQLPRPERFIPAHPMAGSEHQGPAAARADLFHGKPCVICGDTEADSEARRRVEAVWAALGMALLPMNPQQHDAYAASVSHLPHLVSAALIAVAEQRGGWDVASTGFRDTTRLASSNPPMRADIVLANREPILDALDAMIDELTALRRRLGDAQSVDQLEPYFAARKSTRDRWLEWRSGNSAAHPSNPAPAPDPEP